MIIAAVPERDRARVLPRAGALLFLCVAMCLLFSVKPKAYSTTKQFSMRVGQEVQLSLKGVDQSLIWRVETGRKIVKMNQNGVLKAKKAGRAVILVNYNGETYRFRVRIRKRKSGQSQGPGLIELPVPPVGGGSSAPDAKLPRLGLATATGDRVSEDRLILIGDSRFEGMKNVVGGSATWIAAEGEGIYWLRDKVIPKLNSLNVKNRSVVINLGVNDLTETSTYVSVLTSLGNRLRKRGATVYFMTVNPTEEEKIISSGYKVRIANESIVRFNRTIATSLNGFGIINTYDYLVDHGFQTVDGLHYSKDTYRTIYTVLCDAIRE